MAADILAFIDRRHGAEREERMIVLTERVRNLTVAVVVISSVALAVAVIALWVALTRP